VFARDVSDDTAAKAFFAVGYEYFCRQYYPALPRKHVYEVLQEELPTKLYLDLDAPPGDEAAFRAEARAFVEACLGMLDIGGRPPAVHFLHASTAAKRSMHVVVDIFFESVSAVGAFVEAALRAAPCDYVDRAVYTRNRCFRVVHSTKRGRAAPLRGAAGETYDPDEVFATLIQARVGAHSASTLPRSGADAVWGGGCRRRVTGGAPASSTIPAPPALRAFIEGIGARVRGVKEDDKSIRVIVGGVQCPWKGARHASNNAYFTVMKRTGTGWFRCADDDCPRAGFRRADYGWLV